MGVISDNSKKSQAAMEFLMTYGWAILVVLAAIAALAYFGVLSPEKFLPQKCVLDPGIACVQYKVEPSQTTLILSNGLGRSISIDQIVVGSCTQTYTGRTLPSGTEDKFLLTGCSNGVSKDQFKGDIDLSYTDTTYNISKTMHGSIATKVE